MSDIPGWAKCDECGKRLDPDQDTFLEIGYCGDPRDGVSPFICRSNCILDTPAAPRFDLCSRACAVAFLGLDEPDESFQVKG